MDKWKIDYQELSNNVWMVTLIHESGPKVELTGTDLDSLIEEGKRSALELEIKIKEKIIQTKQCR